MYGEYCSNHEKALRLLMELNKIPNIRTFLLVRQTSGPQHCSHPVSLFLLVFLSSSAVSFHRVAFISIFRASIKGAESTAASEASSCGDRMQPLSRLLDEFPLPAVWVCGCLGHQLCTRLLEWWWRNSTHAGIQPMKTLANCGSAIFSVGGTFFRLGVWRSEVRRWCDCGLMCFHAIVLSHRPANMSESVAVCYQFFFFGFL